MGVIGGSLGLIFGLVLLLFAGTLSKFLRWSGGNKGQGASSGIMGWKKENGKYKVGMAPSVANRFGEKKATLIIRVVGIICIIFSIFAFFNSQGI